MSDSSTLPSPNTAIWLFELLTLGYSIVQYITKEKYDAIAMIVYFMTLLVLQFGLNVNLTKALCNEVHFKTAFFYTMFPWIFIFGLLNLMLIIFPGWLKPFSNTFGYFIVNTGGGLSNIFGKILKSKEQTQNSDLSAALGQIYQNPSLLINEIPNPTVGFEDFWHNLDKGGLLISNAKDYYTKLQDLVRLKFIISKSIWLGLTGAFTIVTSYNYIIQAQCSSSVKEMKRRHNKYQEEVKENSKKEIEPRIYSDHGH